MGRIFLASLLVLLLAACVPIKSVDTQLSLRAEERWEVQIEILMPAEAQLYASTIAQTLAESIAEMQQEGIETSWEQNEPDREGNLSYVLTLKGQGYDRLNQGVLEQDAITVEEVNGRRRIVFQYSTMGDLFGVAVENTFTLRGGQILSSNGVKISKSTVQWTNPTGSMEAVLTESSGSSWAWFLLLILAGVGGFFGYRAIQRRTPLPGPFAPTPASSQRYQPGAIRHCSQCRFQIPPEASFCPNCGAPKQ